VVVVNTDASAIDLTQSPPDSAAPPVPDSLTFTPTPNRHLPTTSSGGLSATGTRGSRALTASAAHKKDAQAALGISASESHHKQVFRRTYSSNSIKTRSVEVSPSSFQKIKLLGKGDVGKVYLVREKKTDKLFAMKGESSQVCSAPA
jgi:protein-serine/threonine kinase